VPRTKNGANLDAFLDTIAVSEGTAGKGDDGYNVLVGGDLFNNYDDHPRRLIKIRNDLSSTAAGRYQLLQRYYDYYKEHLGLPDFSPESQDQIAIQQISESNALEDIEAGLFVKAVAKCAHIWASLPGAGYGQHEQPIHKLIAAYTAAGGDLA
jgi:muramidase (phage lysozyme)